MRKEIKIYNRIAELERVRDFVEELASELGFSQELAMSLNLVLEESVTNVIFYAYPDGTEAQIRLAAESDGHLLTLLLSDQGQPFDPTLRKGCDLSISPAEREIGGMGITIIRQIMDEVSYQRLDGTNHLTMKKHIHPKRSN